MAKNDRRKSKVPQPSSIPLFVIAGLPKSVSGETEKVIEGLFRKPFKAVQSPTTDNDASFYSSAYIKALLTAVAGFSQARRKSTSEMITPRAIYLFYVPSTDSEALLRAFDFSVFPVPLPKLAEWDLQGKMLRNDRNEIRAAIGAAIEQLQSAEEAFERIRTLRPKDAILLPPRNFLAQKDVAIGDLFLEMRRGARPWTDRFAELSPAEFNSETLPILHHGKKQHCFVDARDIVFYQPPPGAFHGGAWELDDVDAAEAANTLRGLYRFGAPLPSGFQHDAQLKAGANFQNERFECARQGNVTVSADHANIYPNDVVRPGKKKS